MFQQYDTQRIKRNNLSIFYSFRIQATFSKSTDREIDSTNQIIKDNHESKSISTNKIAPAEIYHRQKKRKLVLQCFTAKISDICRYRTTYQRKYLCACLCILLIAIIIAAILILIFLLKHTSNTTISKTIKFQLKYSIVYSLSNVQMYQIKPLHLDGIILVLLFLEQQVLME